MSVTNILFLFFLYVVCLANALVSLHISIAFPFYLYVYVWLAIEIWYRAITTTSTFIIAKRKLIVINSMWWTEHGARQTISKRESFWFRFRIFHKFLDTIQYSSPDIIHLTFSRFKSEPNRYQTSFNKTRTHNINKKESIKHLQIWKTKAEFCITLKLLTSVYDVRFISFVAFLQQLSFRLLSKCRYIFYEFMYTLETHLWCPVLKLWARMRNVQMASVWMNWSLSK